MFSLFTNRIRPVKGTAWSIPSGNILLPLEYDNLSLFYGMYPSDKLKRSELVQAVSHGKTGVFDLAGKPVVPIAYGAVNLFDNDRILVEKDGKWGMIDRAGNVLLPFDYDYLERLSDTLLQAKKRRPFRRNPSGRHGGYPV